LWDLSESFLLEILSKKESVPYILSEVPGLKNPARIIHEA
jgi:hypothetical protein